jgi:GWxTD domain-containing protein
MGTAQRRVGRWGTLLLLVGFAGCQWQRVGSDTGPDPSLVVPQLFDPATLYRRMGFLASGPPLPYVGTIRYLATDRPDTALAIFALSLANNALGFRRVADGFEARYTAELVLRRGGTIVARVNANEQVRVATREEARRADESVIFQKLLRLPPGTYQGVVSIRDEQTGSVGRIEQAFQVPRVAAPGLSAPIAVYQAGARRTPGDPPPLLLNPRATVPFGLDTLRLYLEAYGADSGAAATFVLIGPTGDSLLSRAAPLVGDRLIASATVEFVPDELPVGQLQVLATVTGMSDTARATALVSFSDQWAITNFDEILTLLRFFGQDRAVAKMRDADPAERPALWRDFWRATDPNPATPQNEALETYFQRVQEANERFHEAGVPGWMTDRGEVFITMGEPDEVFDSSSDLQGPQRIIQWNYLGERLALDFVDDTGFGRFRLSATSRAEYQRVLTIIRSRG